ncbi:glucose 1-dehydrogenase [Subtercola boreus]|nr:glucose 1-dehydrogenase [Subtercola boreus]TQL54526.1 3alpha(or 20beta)-hydroxysteroid dehydrogenase [Subtercola boreus]
MDKTVLITGGAQGMGASHVRAFVDEDARVVFTDLNESAGEKLSEELGGSVRFIRHDVVRETDWLDVVTKTEAAFGPIGVLVNNAGITINQPIEEMSEATYRKLIDVNQVAVFLGMKAVLPSMRKAGGGSIVNISSIAGMVGIPNAIGYNASKFAVRGMTKTAALEFAQYGIRVNSVHPGSIDTPMVNNGNAEEMDALAESIPMKRLGRPGELSQLVLFLASDASSYSTGSEFTADGGVTASI